MAKQAKKLVAPRVSPACIDWLAVTFRSQSNGAYYILDAFRVLYLRTLQQLKGRFSEGELSLMIDIANGTLLTPELAGQHLALSCQDAMTLDGLDKKWHVDDYTLNSKLANLTLFESVCLEIWANSYWYGGTDSAHGYHKLPELADWVSQLA